MANYLFKVKKTTQLIYAKLPFLALQNRYSPVRIRMPPPLSIRVSRFGRFLKNPRCSQNVPIIYS